MFKVVFDGQSWLFSTWEAANEFRDKLISNRSWVAYKVSLERVK